MTPALPPSRGLALVGSCAALCAAAFAPAAGAHDGGGKVLTQARFLHAVPGAPRATLIVHGHPPRIESSYGQPSAYQNCKPGPAKVELKVEGQKKPAATADLEIGRGSYTVIAVPDNGKVGLLVFKDGAATPGKARLRTINAAAELDRAEMRVDDQPVSWIRPAAATRYASVPPGRHDLAITRPGGQGGALASASGVPLTAGTASSAIVVGSRGEPAQILLVADKTVGSSVAPATGFIGDVGGASAWLLVLFSALMAGSLGGGAYLLLNRRPAPAAPSIPPPPAPPAPPARAPIPRRPSLPPRDPTWLLKAGAALTAGSLVRRLYRRSRRGR
jgi:Domain of unknown function (DUF4397)